MIDPVTTYAAYQSVSSIAQNTGISSLWDGSANESVKEHAYRLAREYAGSNTGKYQTIAEANYQILQSDRNAAANHHRAGAIQTVDRAMKKYLDGTFGSLDQIRAEIRPVLERKITSETGWTTDLVNLYVNTAAAYCGAYTPPVTINQVAATEYRTQQGGAIARTSATASPSGTALAAGTVATAPSPLNIGLVLAVVAAVIILARK